MLLFAQPLSVGICSFSRQNGRVTASVGGPLTKATPVAQAEGTEWFGVTFPLGTFLPSVPIRNLLDKQAILPLAAKTSFELAGSIFQFPDYENAETFVERLVREDVLVSDPVVKAILIGQPQEMSLRTVRRRFLLATGLTYKAISQIERAKQAEDLLEQGVSLLETAYQAGYADQSYDQITQAFHRAQACSNRSDQEAEIAVHIVQDKIPLALLS